MKRRTLVVPRFEPIINYQVKIDIDPHSSFHFLLGQNGIGKTILAKSIIGLNGNGQFSELLINDQDILLLNSAQFRRYLPQNPEDAIFPQFSILDNIKILCRLLGIRERTADIEFVELLEVQSLWTPAAKLSVGQKKKLLLKLILDSLPPLEQLNAPIIVVLDEPFAGIDKTYSIVVRDLLNSAASKYCGSSVVFFVIEHETLLDIPSSVRTDFAVVRNGVSMKIAYVKQIELR